MARAPVADDPVAAAVEAARRAHPGLALDPDGFAGLLRARLDPAAPAAGALERLQVADLYLAQACARGDAQALRRFEDGYLARIDAGLLRTSVAPDVIAELRQVLRERLLVAPPGEAPRIASYDGRGTLRSWVAVVASRALVSLLRKRDPGQAGHDGDDAALATLAQPGADAELESMRRESRQHFRDAFVAALATLTPRQRNLLRHQVHDGLALDQIAALYRTPRSTMARHLADARERLVSATRSALARRLDLPRSEVDSLVRLLGSRFELSVRELLRSEPEPAG